MKISFELYKRFGFCWCDECGWLVIQLGWLLIDVDHRAFQGF